MNPSPVLRALYSINAPKARVVITPEGGNLYGTQPLTMRSPDGAEIRYESAQGTDADGSPNNPPREPIQGNVSDGTGSPIYDTSAASPTTITLNQGTVETPNIYTYWIRAFKDGLNPGDIVKLTFRVYPQKAGTLAPTLNAGNHRGNKTLKLTLTDADPAAAIVYTITRTADGTEPAEPTDPTQDTSASGSTAYTAAGIPLDAPAPLASDLPNIFIVKARAFAAGKVPGDILQLRYEIRAPKVNPVVIEREPGDTFGRTLLKLSSPTPDAEIRYTLTGDGTEPADPVQGPEAAGGSPIYDPAAPPSIKPDALNQPKTFRIKARAFKTGFLPSDPAPENIQLNVAVSQIAIGGHGGILQYGSRYYNSVFLVVNDGTLWGIGDNQYGQLGNGETISEITQTSGGTTSVIKKPLSTVLSRVKNTDGSIFNNVKLAAVGGDFTAVLKNDGSVWTFGRNEYGQLGDGTTTDRLNPVKVRGSGITSIAAGADHLVVVDTAGRAYAAGRNTFGQLGNNSTTDSANFVQMRQAFGAARKFVKASAGWYHTLLLDDRGGAWAAGKNSTPPNSAAGILGVGTTNDEKRLRPVKGPEHVVGTGSLGNVKDIWGFGINSVFLMKNGEIRASGSNAGSQLARPRSVGTSAISSAFAIRLGQADSEGNLTAAITNADKLPTGAHGDYFIAYIDKNGRLNGAGIGGDIFPSPAVANAGLTIPFSKTDQFSNAVSFSMAEQAFSILQTADGKIWVGAGSAPLPGIRSEFRASRFQEYNPLR